MEMVTLPHKVLGRVGLLGAIVSSSLCGVVIGRNLVLLHESYAVIGWRRYERLVRYERDLRESAVTRSLRDRNFLSSIRRNDSRSVLASSGVVREIRAGKLRPFEYVAPGSPALRHPLLTCMG